MIALVITALVAIEAIGIMVVEVFGSTPQQAVSYTHLTLPTICSV